MRAGMHVAGSSIDRVFNQPIAPARKFRGTIDAALTLALGSVCAFALTLGPAPMNTVALSAPAVSATGGSLDPGSGTLPMPDTIDQSAPGDDVPDETFRARTPASPEATDAAPSTDEQTRGERADASTPPAGQQAPKGKAAQHQKTPHQTPQQEASQHPSPPEPPI